MAFRENKLKPWTLFGRWYGAESLPESSKVVSCETKKGQFEGFELLYLKFRIWSICLVCSEHRWYGAEALPVSSEVGTSTKLHGQILVVDFMGTHLKPLTLFCRWYGAETLPVLSEVVSCKTKE